MPTLNFALLLERKCYIVSYPQGIYSLNDQSAIVDAYYITILAMRLKN